MENILKEENIRQFYKQVIECYLPHIKESYWGVENDFLELIEEAEKTPEEDTIHIYCKNGEEIILSSSLFDFLFKRNNYSVFDAPIGQRFEYEDYVYLELIESPFATINKKIEETGIFPISKDQNDNIESCFFIKADMSKEKNYDYPKEVLPFFVSQMKMRTKKIGDRLPSYFIEHFESMKYILKVKKTQNNSLIKLLYKLGINLGIIENLVEDENLSFEVEQEIKSKLDEEGNINITNDNDKNLDSLNFYISAIRNPNPYYRFLDAYHILEASFYKYFYNYVKNLNSNMNEKSFHDEIKKHTTEPNMLKLVLKDCLDDHSSVKNIKNNLINNVKTKKLANAIGKNYNIQDWSDTNIEEFVSKLSIFIYDFRNAIVHSKESDTHIEKIQETPNLISEFNKLANVVLNIAKLILEKNIERW